MVLTHLTDVTAAVWWGRLRTGPAHYRLIISVFFLLIPPPPRPTLFPYTTLFRPRRLGCDRRADHREPGASRARVRDRKSTRLNSSHTVISYAVFCLKKKKNNRPDRRSRLLRRTDSPARTGAARFWR